MIENVIAGLCWRDSLRSHIYVFLRNLLNMKQLVKFTFKITVLIAPT